MNKRLICARASSLKSSCQSLVIKNKVIKFAISIDTEDSGLSNKERHLSIPMRGQFANTFTIHTRHYCVNPKQTIRYRANLDFLRIKSSSSDIPSLLCPRSRWRKNGLSALFSYNDTIPLLRYHYTAATLNTLRSDEEIIHEICIGYGDDAKTSSATIDRTGEVEGDGV